MEKSYDAKHKGFKSSGRLLIRSVGRLLSKILKYDYVFRIFTHKRVFKLRKRGNLPC